MRAKDFALIAIVLTSVGAAGCTGCLGFDKYKLVSEPVGGGGSGAGGAGGGGAPSCVPNNAVGEVVASYLVLDGADVSHGSCGATGTPPSVELAAVTSNDGSCLASGHISASKGTVLSLAPAVHFGRDEEMLVAGSFRKGKLTFPKACAGGADVTLDGETDATAAMFFALVTHNAETFCTNWARRAFTSDSGAASSLKIGAARSDSAAGIAVTGSLGQALVHFGDASDATNDVHGGPFLVTFQTSDGAIENLQGLAGAAPDDTALGLASSGAAWLATGTVENARPDCHTCSGPDDVTGKKPSCSLGDGGGGAGGGGGASADPSNAMIWTPAANGTSCELSTSGDDTEPGDAQIGFGLALEPSSDVCGAYWNGFAGSSAWSIEGVGLFVGGSTENAFLARLNRFAGDCSGGPPPFTLGFVPSISGASAWGHRVAPLACGAGPVASTVIKNAAGGRVDVHRCSGATPPCDVASAEAPLAASATKQLLLTGFDASGALSWSGAFGPLVVDAAAAPLPGRSHDDLATDDGGRTFVVFTTDGPLVTENINALGCDFTTNDAAGTWLVALGTSIDGQKASCTWARRLGP